MAFIPQKVMRGMLGLCHKEGCIFFVACYNLSSPLFYPKKQSIMNDIWLITGARSCSSSIHSHPRPYKSILAGAWHPRISSMLEYIFQEARSNPSHFPFTNLHDILGDAKLRQIALRIISPRTLSFRSLSILQHQGLYIDIILS